MQHRFSYEFDVAFIRTALKRDFAWRGVYLLIAFAAIFAGSWILTGGFPTLVAIVIGITVPLALIRLGVALARGSRRVFDLWCKQSPSRTIVYELDDEGFEIKMENSSARYEWRGLRRLWRHPDVWIVEIVKNLSVFFPPQACPDQVREFIVERCRQADVRV